MSKMLKYFANNSKKLLFNSCIKRNYCQSLYIQGQTVDNKIREYFYYIDHEGMVSKSNHFSD